MRLRCRACFGMALNCREMTLHGVYLFETVDLGCGPAIELVCSTFPNKMCCLNTDYECISTPTTPSIPGCIRCRRLLQLSRSKLCTVGMLVETRYCMWYNADTAWRVTLTLTPMMRVALLTGCGGARGSHGGGVRVCSHKGASTRCCSLLHASTLACPRLEGTIPFC